MTKVGKTVLAVLAVSIATGLSALLVAHSARQSGATHQIQTLRGEADALIKEKEFAQASDRLERLQILLMKERQYEEALKVSFEIEEVAGKASERRSPWHYVRIGEVYLAMGQRDRFFEWVGKAIHERSFSRLEYFRNEQLDGVRNDPRFKDLVAACAAVIGVGKPAKDFEVTLLDGSPFRLSAQRGKVVLVDFWDVRCAPCLKEMPNLKAVYGEFKERGLEILGISLDTERPLLKDYLKQAALPWKIACSWDGWNDATAKLYQISATPSTWLIDRRGVVRYCDVRGEELRKALEVLIAEDGIEPGATLRTE
jgi:peroxiredoxin